LVIYLTMSDVMFVGVGEGESPVPLFFIAIVSLVLVSSWVILAASRFVQGGSVERPERVPQLYGYTVCLVALLVAFASLVSIFDNVATLTNPAHPRSEMASWAEPSVTSFEAFRLSYDRTRQVSSGPNAPTPEAVPEDELRRRYEALRADRISRTSVAAQRALGKAVFTLLVASTLFFMHWRWLRRRVEPGVTAA
jgi:hypothetical protein